MGIYVKIIKDMAWASSEPRDDRYSRFMVKRYIYLVINNKYLIGSTTILYKLSREGLFTLSKERVQTGEILFQPQLGGVVVHIFKNYKLL
ncbi:actin-related protein 8-like [Spinacia oleracea]|uniref:Actin-related protein 8-like n=1 Tax=Spinacia oleracea TaxID=3562 RepID=A0ABM3REL2_SPIOL|nr:actin-related protein 8-like [Spinacia oleracea]XP_056694061.1 actin-related protein 8-like [Spinacia oleracea]